MSSDDLTYDFEAMKRIDIRTINRESLVDIRNVSVDSNLPFIEKAEMFLAQIKNPYCFKCGDVIVKINYANTETTIDDCMEGFYRSLRTAKKGGGS